MSAAGYKNFSPTRSLVGRFVLASLILLPLFIFLSGTLLSNAFEHSQIKAEREKLQTQLYLLLSLTEIENQTLQLPEALTEPRFNQLNSGLYGFIYNEKGEERWRSPSALLVKSNLFTPLADFQIGQQKSVSLTLENGETVTAFAYDIEWVDEANHLYPLRFVTTNNTASLKAEVDSYQTRLWQWLSLMGLLLIVAQMVIMRWGLVPLKRLSQQLSELQEGKRQKLSDDYPEEIKPVTHNFNTILEHEKKQRERYRNTMSDLAHSLKTPLAVMQSHTQQDDTANDQTLSEQIERINQIISHQLKRAVIRVNQNALSTSTKKVSIKNIVVRLTKILGKVYADKHIEFINVVPEDLGFNGDEADLLEVMGNLLDNACKYGKDKVVIHAALTTAKPSTTGTENNENKPFLTICISDNGPGIPTALQNNLLERGSRGDTAQAGQGIGLSVAVDIMSSYGGGLEVRNQAPSPHLSGACFCISFPHQK